MCQQRIFKNLIPVTAKPFFENDITFWFFTYQKSIDEMSMKRQYKIKTRIRIHYLLVFTFIFSLLAVGFESLYLRNIGLQNQDIIRSALINNNDSIFRLIDEKRQSLQINSEDCFCENGRTNWIHYDMCVGKDQPHGAGIKDRQNILRNLMWYADELCANIALECPPSTWLAKEHGCISPDHATWDVYFTPIRKNSIGDSVSKVDILYSNINTTDTFRGLRRLNDGSIETYEMARKLHDDNIPFVWKFNKSFWDTDLYDPKHVWPRQIFSHRKYSPSCGLLDFDASEELLNIGEHLLRELKIQSSREYVTLHLRRGDYMLCDTDPTTIMSYLNCSIADDDVKKVVVLTNGDDEYKVNLSQTFKDTFPTKEMIMIDQVMKSKSFLEKLNKNQVLSVHSEDDFLIDNCFRFSAEKVIVNFARYHLERGHGYCKGSCDRGGSVKKNGAAMLR
jgi:hypothetical protein